MATNGPNGSNPTGNINFNSNPDVQPGILGYQLGQSTKRQFTNDFWKDGGYLSESIKELEEMKRQYKEMSKEVSNLSKAEQKNFRERKQALNQQLALLKTIRENQEASDTEAIDAINSSNKLRLKGQQDLIKLLNSLIEIQDKADQEHLDNLDAAVEKYNQIKQSTDETKERLKQTSQILNKASDSLSASLSKTLDAAGDKLKDLSNMFNLQSMANYTNQFDAKNRANIIGTVNRQFGFTSNAQFNEFKNSLISELEKMNDDMGNLFGSDDLRTYMSKLDDYGVTSTQMAQSQMRSSLIATKYLATSDETMTKMFKYMKMSNNNALIEDFNKSTISIMKAQLGVSEKQLDELRNSNLDVGTAIEQLGGLAGGEFVTDLEKVQSAMMSSGYSQYAVEGIAKEFARILEEGYSSGYDANTLKTINDAMQRGDAWTAVNALMNSNQAYGYSVATKSGDLFTNSAIRNSMNSSNILSDNLMGVFSTNASNPNAMDNAYQQYLKTKNIESGLTTQDVEDAVSSSQPIGLIQQWMNKLSLEFDKLPWGSYIALADAAFALYIGSTGVKLAASGWKLITNNIVPGIKNIGSFFKGGGSIKDIFNAFLGKGSVLASNTATAATNTASAAASSSSLVSGLVATGGGILIGAAASKLLADVIQGAQQKTYESNVNAAKSQLKGTSLEGNSAAESAIGASLTAGSENNNFFSGWGAGISSTVTGIGSAWTKAFGDLSKLNSNEYQLFLNKMTMIKGSSEDKLPYFYAWYLLADSANRLSDISNKTGNISSDDLKAYVQSSDFSKSSVLAAVNDIVNNWNKGPYSSKDQRQKSIDWDRYAMNGVDWVPRDNYLINAHKGEMLLTADEAKVYRSMLMPKNAGDVREGFYSVDDGRRGGNYPYPITSAWNEARDGGRHHTGVDFGMSQGTPIGASIPGKVASASYNGGYGNLVVVQANDGKRILYAHQSKMAVKTGQQVNAGTLIGYVGSTGNSTGPHLHFEVRRTADYGTDIDPLPYVTNSLFNVGDTSGTVLSSSTDNFNNAQESDGSVQVKTRRFVPKAFTGNMGGEDNAGRIVNSVDGGFNKLISYLDSIRDEQVKQRALLNAFSKSRIPESTF